MIRENITFNVPVLLINFNRPAHTAKVLDQIRKARPSVLYFAADAPRENNETDKIECYKVRQLINTVDWPCQIYTLFSEKNLGCKYGPVTAINWLFSREDKGIILEDDILPDQSFFIFCEEMLQKYKDDHQVLMISGRNELGKWRHKKCDYFFTLGGCWGWATWKRAWDLHDPEIIDWTEEIREGLRKKYEPRSKPMFNEMEMGCNAVKHKDFDAWDYQWLFTKLFYGTKDIMPTVNLIKYIGFGNLATHSKGNLKDKLPVFSMSSYHTCCTDTEIDYNYINRSYKRNSQSQMIHLLVCLKKYSFNFLKIMKNSLC